MTSDEYEPRNRETDDTALPRVAKKIKIIQSPRTPETLPGPYDDALRAAQKLIGLGVPVVVCRPNPEWKAETRTSDVLPPKGWSLIEADECDLETFRPGVDTLAMVTGHGIDVVDVDPKNAGDVANMEAFKFFGVHGTPSGGQHYLVASTGLAKMVLTTSKGHVGDYLGGSTDGGGRGLAYLPGSTRPKYPNGAYTIQQELDTASVQAAGPDPSLIDQLRAAGAVSDRSAGKPAKSLPEVRQFYDGHPQAPHPECGYGRAAVEALVEEADTTDPGHPVTGRHAWAVRAATRCVDLVKAGCASSADLDLLEEKLEEIKPEGGTDWVGVVAWAISNSDGACGCDIHASRVDLVAQYAEFWESSPQLRTIRDYSRARMVSPWAVLGCVLARVLTSVPPNVVLPAITGGVASLNFFVALLGESGTGKGAAQRVADDVVLTDDIYVTGPGSGEGLNHIYAHYNKAEDRYQMHRTAALLSAPEIDSLRALAGRQASTLSNQLRKGWMGEELSFSYAAREKAVPVKAHTYRLGMEVGVQPDRAEWLLNEGEGGLPQRFLWAPATDPGAPDVPPEAPDPIDLRDSHRWDEERYEVGVPEAVKEEVQRQRRETLRGNSGKDSLSGHRYLARLKVAAALSFLGGRRDIPLDDWQRAGTIIDVSDRTLRSVQRHLRDKHGRSSARRTQEQTQLEKAKTQAAEDQRHSNSMQTLLRALQQAPEGLAASKLRKTLSGDRRQYYDDAISALIDQGAVREETIDYNGKIGKRFTYVGTRPDDVGH